MKANPVAATAVPTPAPAIKMRLFPGLWFQLGLVENLALRIDLPISMPLCEHCLQVHGLGLALAQLEAKLRPFILKVRLLHGAVIFLAPQHAVRRKWLESV